MLEYLNSAACLALMLYSLPIAMTIGNRGLWLERLSICAVQFGLFLRMTNPWADWTAPATWTEVYLNVAAVILLTVWRRRVWIFVRSYLAPASELGQKRRRSDWAEPTAPMRYHLRGTPKA